MVMQDIDLVHLKDEVGETPLYIAAEYGKDEVFRLLEDFGSDCFAKRNDGCTVLHAAKKWVDFLIYRFPISTFRINDSVLRFFFYILLIPFKILTIKFRLEALLDLLRTYNYYFVLRSYPRNVYRI